MSSVLFKLLTRAQYDALQSVDNGTLYRVSETGGGESFYQGTNKLDRNDLDVAEFALASISEGIVTIKGIKETDGSIAVGTDTTKDISLAKIASTGAAADVSIADAGGLIAAETVEGALQELATASAGGVASKTVWLTDASSGQSDYAKVFRLYQGANSPEALTDPATLVGTINIPKDKVLQAASIVDITFSSDKLYDGVTDVTALIKGETTPTSADAGKYLKMEMQNVTDPLYVNLQTFVDVYGVQLNATEVQLTLTDHVFSATIVKIDASKIEYKAETSSGAGDGETVKQALQRLDGSDSTTGSVAKIAKDAAAAAVAALDTSNDVAIASETSGVVTIKAGISETDGIIGAGSGTDIVLDKVATTGAAEDLDYTNTTSGLTSTNVQDALDEIAGTAGSAVQSVTEGSVDGAIDVDGTSVPVHGLGSAALEDTTAFDAAGSAAAVLGTNQDDKDDITVYGGRAYTDDAIASALEWQTVS